MKSQKGFAVVEALLVIVIIAMISGIGWYVWRGSKNTSDILSNAQSDGANTASSAKKTANNVSVKPGADYTGWKTFTAPKEGFTLKYPSDWTVVKGNNEESYDLTAPDGLIIRYVYLDTLGSDLGSCGHQSMCPTQKIISIDSLGVSSHPNIQLIKTLPDDYNNCYAIHLNESDNTRKPKVGDNTYDDSYFFYSLKSKDTYRYSVETTNSTAGTITFNCDNLTQAQFFNTDSVIQAEKVLRSISF